MTEALSQLPRLSWRGIKFPFDEVSTDHGHDLVAHKMPDRDGARQENTGLNERVIIGHALFRNGIKFDVVYAQPWFPDVFQTFMASLRDRSAGELIHPVHGSITCKVKAFKDRIHANGRDGADVDITWVEHTEDPDETPADAPAAPLSAAVQAAAQLDSDVAAIRASGKTPPTSYNFTDSMRAIRAFTDTASLVSKRNFALIAQVQYQLNATRDSLDRLGDVTMNAVRTSVEKLQSALYDLNQTQKVVREVAFYVVPKATTLGGIASKLAASTTDLLTLNASLAGSPIIAARTVVRYYRG